MIEVNQTHVLILATIGMAGVIHLPTFVRLWHTTAERINVTQMAEVAVAEYKGLAILLEHIIVYLLATPVAIVVVATTMLGQ